MSYDEYARVRCPVCRKPYNCSFDSTPRKCRHFVAGWETGYEYSEDYGIELIDATKALKQAVGRAWKEIVRLGDRLFARIGYDPEEPEEQLDEDELRRRLHDAASARAPKWVEGYVSALAGHWLGPRPNGDDPLGDYFSDLVYDVICRGPNSARLELEEIERGIPGFGSTMSFAFAADRKTSVASAIGRARVLAGEARCARGALRNRAKKPAAFPGNSVGQRLLAKLASMPVIPMAPDLRPMDFDTDESDE